MTLPNRVAPDGALEADPARGLLMGNRGGRFHRGAAAPARPWASRQWIICTLDFKGRAGAFQAAGRRVWGEHRYTELFFCDEVTALAAGHRPCMECRRAANLAFREAAREGGAFPARPSCPELDRRLDGERREGRAKRLHATPMAALPDAAMVAIGGRAFAVRGDVLLPWSQAGYGPPVARPGGEAAVLTPPSTLAALRAGYAPLWHPSALIAG